LGVVFLQCGAPATTSALLPSSRSLALGEGTSPKRPLPHLVACCHADVLERFVSQLHPVQVAEKEGIGSANKYGFFVPAHRGAGVSGWLPTGATLAGLNLGSGMQVDFSLRSGRQVTIWDATMDVSQSFAWDDALPIKRNLVAIYRELASKKLVRLMQPAVNRKVVVLNKNELLLNYPFTDECEYVLAMQDGWKPSLDASEEDILDNVYFYVQVPYHEGWLWKKSSSGFFRGWKKMWCVLSKDSMLFYPEKEAQLHVNAIHIRTVEFCIQSEPIDGHSKKLGHIFKVGTNTAEREVYVGVEQKYALTTWMTSIAKWLTFFDFFKPKAIKERGVALSSILSGQVPNWAHAHTQSLHHCARQHRQHNNTGQADV
jgi:hypothetical protein